MSLSPPAKRQRIARQLCREEYTVGWVCALSIELAVAEEMLDEEHDTPHCDAHDTNIYTCGRIGEHNVVIACLPEGQMGTNSAAAVAVQMKSSFTSTRFGLMVGIGGGVPSDADVRLGDVVVSKPHNVHGGVVQYDFGKTTPSGFERTGSLNSPPTLLLTAIAKLKAKHIRGRGRFLEYFSKLESLPNFGREAAGLDVLFEANYNHKEGSSTCERCDIGRSVARRARRKEVVVHYGTIASGNQVMRSATQRDAVSADLGGVLCFEMEAAGLMNNFPCLVIRGICDYADSHKNKQWQPYAAGIAAAYAKEVLSVIPPSLVKAEKKIIEVLSDFQEVAEEHRNIAKDNLVISQKSLEIQQKVHEEELSDRQKSCLHLFRLTKSTEDATYEWYKDRIEDRVASTCTWFLKHDNFQKWTEQESGLLLVSADPGCGKSVLAKYLIDYVLPESATVCYFFFKDQDQNTVRQALCALLHQLFSQKPLLVGHAMRQYERDGKGLIHSTSSLWKILEDATQDQQSGSIIIVLDALDECAESEYEDLMRNIESQSRSNQSRHGKLKYILTSRPYKSIVSGFRRLLKSFPHIHIPGEEESETISQEVNQVIIHRVKRLAVDEGLTTELSSHLENALGKIEHRTYLWVHLVFDYLKTEGFIATRRGIDSALKLLPRSVNQAYERILTKSKDQPMVQKVLAIILAATRPLTLSEMNIALGVDETTQSFQDINLEEEEHFKSRLRTWCGLFVSVYHGKVHLLHQTAREFLLATDLPSTAVSTELKWHGSITLQYAHSVLAECCVRFLCLFGSVDNVIKDENPNTDSCIFLEYSAIYWALHFRESNICEENNAAVATLASTLSEPDANIWSVWSQIYWNIKEYGVNTTRLILACFFGHMSVLMLHSEALKTPPAERRYEYLVEGWLRRIAEANAKGGDFSEKLQAASIKGHTQVVELLLKERADDDLRLGSHASRFHLASIESHMQVMKLLHDDF